MFIDCSNDTFANGSALHPFGTKLLMSMVNYCILSLVAFVVVDRALFILTFFFLNLCLSVVIYNLFAWRRELSILQKGTVRQ